MATTQIQTFGNCLWWDVAGAITAGGLLVSTAATPKHFLTQGWCCKQYQVDPSYIVGTTECHYSSYLLPPLPRR
jgi:hypothetical protein